MEPRTWGELEWGGPLDICLEQRPFLGLAPRTPGLVERGLVGKGCRSWYCVMLGSTSTVFMPRCQGYSPAPASQVLAVLRTLGGHSWTRSSAPSQQDAAEGTDPPVASEVEAISQEARAGKEEHGRYWVVAVGNGLVCESQSSGKHPDDLGEALKGRLIQGCMYSCSIYATPKSAWPEA